MIRLLVELGADIKAKDKDGRTVLYWATLEENKAMVRLLVELGADIESKDNDGSGLMI